MANRSTSTALAARPLNADVGLDKQTISVEDLVQFSGFNIVELAEMRGEGGVAKDADNAALLRFIAQAQAKGLDPRKRQCFFIPRGGKWTFTTSIDGLSSIADRTQRFGGADAPEYRGTLELKDGTLVPAYAEVCVWKIVGPWEHPVTRPFRGTADWVEFYPGDGEVGRMWRKMPRRMLAKCALAQALRLAFPEQLADIELQDDTAERIVEVRERPTPPRPYVEAAATYQRTIGRDAVADLHQAYMQLHEDAIREGVVAPDDETWLLPEDADEAATTALGRRLRGRIEETRAKKRQVPAPENESQETDDALLDQVEHERQQRMEGVR